MLPQYPDIANFYTKLEKQVQLVHKTASVSFTHLREFLSSAPNLLQSLKLLSETESAPLGNQMRTLHSFLQGQFENLQQTYKLMLELTARCTEMNLQFQSIQQSTTNAKKAFERTLKISPTQLQDAQQVYKNCNRELCRLASTFEKQRYKNYSELIQTTEKTFCFTSAMTLQEIQKLQKCSISTSEQSVINDLAQRLNGLELHIEESLQKILGIEKQKQSSEGLQLTQKGEYGVSSKRYTVVREYSDE